MDQQGTKVCHCTEDNGFTLIEAKLYCNICGGFFLNHPQPSWDLVIEDMRARDVVGIKRYGQRLVAHNGRDTLTDAYEEALDLAVYLRTLIYERDHPQ